MEEDIWGENPSLPVSASVVTARYAWAYTTESRLEVDPQDSHVSVPEICLNEAKTMCVTKALAVTSSTIPACMVQNFNIRATYLRGGFSISILEISKAMEAQYKRIFFCADGSQPILIGQVSNGWLMSAKPEITHITAIIKCPANFPSDKNALGLVIINYYGNCTIPTSNQIFASSIDDVATGLPKTTSALLINTPRTKTFEQAWPNLPKRANKIRVAQEHQKNVSFQFSTCAMAAVFDTNAPFMSHWLWHMYNRVKVEHIIMYTAPEAFDLDSKLVNGTFIRELISTGFLQLVPWHSRFLDKKQIFYRSQWSAYTDFAFRFRGLCHWTIFADVDDFFVSWPNSHNIVPALQFATKLYPDVVTFRLKWPSFFPQCQNISGRLPPYESDEILPHLKYGTLKIANCKSISNTYDYFDIGVHTQPGKYQYLEMPGTAMYHVRAGVSSSRGLLNFDNKTCAKLRLDGYPLSEEKRKTVLFP